MPIKGLFQSYVIMENLIHMLSQYHPEDSLFFGERYLMDDYSNNGYMGGKVCLIWTNEYYFNYWFS